jgi:hypothetical protein
MGFPDFDEYLNRTLKVGRKRHLDSLSEEERKAAIDRWERKHYERDKNCYTEMRELLESEGPLSTTDFFKKLKGKHDDHAIWGAQSMFEYDEDIKSRDVEDERCHYYDTLYKIGEITEKEYCDAFGIDIWLDE